MIAIIGSQGRFGKFLQKELTKRNIPVQGIYLQSTENDKLNITHANFVIFAVPMENLEEALIEYAQYLRPGQIVVDVCSLKIFACRLMAKYLPADVEIIGTHPLFGPQSAKDSIEGQRIALCNVSASEETFLMVTEWLAQAKLKVYTCTPEFHDKQMAVSQALTHFIGRVAESVGIERIPLATKSFDDLMDIIDLVKGSSPDLFRNMQQMNLYAAEINRKFLDSGEELYKKLFS